jgi:hypothetical protein
MIRHAKDRRWKSLEDLIQGTDLVDDDFGTMTVQRRREFAAPRKRLGPTGDLGTERDIAEFEAPSP